MKRYQRLAPGPDVPIHCQPVAAVYQASHGRTSIVVGGVTVKFGACKTAWKFPGAPHWSPNTLVQNTGAGGRGPTITDAAALAPPWVNDTRPSTLPLRLIRPDDGRRQL